MVFTKKTGEFKQQTWGFHQKKTDFDYSNKILDFRQENYGLARQELGMFVTWPTIRHPKLDVLHGNPRCRKVFLGI
jgi:hypothetical protein